MSITITTGSIANRMLFVWAHNANVIGTGGYNTVSTVTGNGTAFTLKTRTQALNAGIYEDIESWYLLAPTASTSYNIIITWGVAGQQNVGGVIEYGGVDQLTTWGAVATNSATATPLAVTVTTTFTNSWVLGTFGWYAGGTGGSIDTVDAAFTKRLECNFGAGAGESGVLADKATTSVGAVGMTNTFTSPGTFTIGVIQALELLEQKSAVVDNRSPHWERRASPMTRKPTVRGAM